MFWKSSTLKPPDRLRRWLKRLLYVGAALLILGLWAGSKAKDFIAVSGGGEAAETKAKIKTLQLILEARHLVDGHYPTEDAGLQSLLPAASGGKDEERVTARLNDAWHRKIRYRFPGKDHPDGYDLISFGPDGIEGTEDDITN